MKRSISKYIVGLLFILVGIGYILKFTGILPGFTIFFDGWWTLFIIVPCLCAFIDNGYSPGALIGLLIGVLLLMAQLDLFSFKLAWQIICASGL